MTYGKRTIYTISSYCTKCIGNDQGIRCAVHVVEPLGRCQTILEPSKVGTVPTTVGAATISGAFPFVVRACVAI